MRVMILQPPSPPLMNVKRDLAGGMGVADPSERTRFGHDPKYITMPNLSSLYTAGVLEHGGHDVAFVDAQLEDLDKDQVVARVQQHRSDFVIAVLNLPSLYGDLEVLKAIRDNVPGVRTIAMGVVTIPLFDFIVESGAVDGIVRGDAELIAPMMIERFAQAAMPVAAGAQGGSRPALRVLSSNSDRFEELKGVLANKQVSHVHDLDTLPPVPYHLVPLEKYWYFPFGVRVPYATIFSSKGCSYRCYYCPYPMGFGENMVYRDPVKIVNEIEALYTKRGIKAFLFRDQVFTMEREKTMQLCDEIIRRGLKISFLVETRLDKIDEELVRKMRKAGCVRMQFGVESGDPQLFEKVGKDGAKGKFNEFFENFQMVERVGVAAHMFILVGLLGETWDTVRHTIETIRRIKPITLQVAVVTPYPGTGLYDQVKRKGLLSTEDFSKFSGFIPVSRTEKLSSEDLLKARQMIIQAHRKAVFWKKQKRYASLAIRYTRDGTIFSRLRRKYEAWASM